MPNFFYIRATLLVHLVHFCTFKAKNVPWGLGGMVRMEYSLTERGPGDSSPENFEKFDPQKRVFTLYIQNYFIKIGLIYYTKPIFVK